VRIIVSSVEHRQGVDEAQAVADRRLADRDRRSVDADDAYVTEALADRLPARGLEGEEVDELQAEREQQRGRGPRRAAR
jgi:hypothetical protein